METDLTAGNKRADEHTLIVGIGASAGGLKALESLLAPLTGKFDFTIVFIQHLSSKHESLLPELIRSQRPDIEVLEIADGLEVLPGRIYLGLPGKNVRIEKELFSLVPQAEGRGTFPIDEFFDSLAGAAGKRAIAVVLSGDGSDGARGILTIRNAGGTVLVQDPATAEFAAMPLAAIGTGQVDAVLSPEDIFREILKIQESSAVLKNSEQLITPAQFETFYSLIQGKTGARFHSYKKSVVARRIRRRMYLHGISALPEYANLIEESDSEAALLASDLMIGVTAFFRDRIAWRALRIEVVNKLVTENDTSPLRIWTPACATGEEAYSIAMLLHHELARAGRKREIQVFATDMNDRALERARAGKYPCSIEADVPPEFIRKYFMRSDNGLDVIVNKDIREYVVFAKQDLLTDPPFSRLDAIICRNLLIYLDSQAQEKCISLFHYALKDGGYLFLGNAESLGGKHINFKTIGHKKCRIYRKIEARPVARLPLSVPYAVERSASLSSWPTASAALSQSVTVIAQDKLLEEYAPAAIAIDQNYDIIYHNGPTNRYLRQPRGFPTQNLLEHLPETQRSRVRGGLYRAIHEAKAISIRISIAGNDEQKLSVTLRISKLRENLFLIVFREKDCLPEPPGALSLEAAAVEETAARQLESELLATRQDLQSHIEQLKSLNEELQTSNEEFQAANEELETSREELQSLNEELITVNGQYQGKIEEQEETNNDLNNFLASTSIPTLFLDHQLMVKRFTPAMSRFIELIPADMGRPIDMFQEHLGPELITDARAVLNQLVPLRKEMMINDAWYVRTLLPYRTQDNHIEGVVVTYNDVTEFKRAEERMRHLASFPQLNPNPVLEADAAGRIVFFNSATKKFLKNLDRETNTRDAALFLPADFDGILNGWDKKTEATLYREVAIKDRTFGETVYLAPQFSVARIYAYEITKDKRAEEALRESEERVRRKLSIILSPEGDIGDLELGDIIDARAIQLLMEDFHKFAPIPMAMIDLKGGVLVGVGWQDICTKFHRVHPDTCKHCIASDTQLSAAVPPGEFKLYKCENNMWDVVTPIMVGGRHVGNLFTGQFFFDDEPLNRERFRSQARQYGFPEEDYLAALEKVPRLSREFLQTVMAYFMKLADILSKMSYSNLKLARSLTERDALTESLRKSEERLNRAQEIAHLGSWELDLVNNVLTWSDEVYRIFGLQPQEFGASYEAFLEAIHPDDRAAVNTAYSASLLEERDAYEIEHRVIRRSVGEIRIVHEKCEHLRDQSGRIVRSVGMVHDITERKQAEREIKLRLEELRAANAELARFNRAAVGRELRMIELKKEINDLCVWAGRQPNYPLDFEREL